MVIFTILPPKEPAPPVVFSGSKLALAFGQAAYLPWPEGFDRPVTVHRCLGAPRWRLL
jgi:hypothetical protein